MQDLMEVFSPQERLVFALRKRYESFGYTRFPMRRFEEYALYLENKSFLKSESVLAFTDANGKVMALKPDVTLSIVKHACAGRVETEKLYYTESVYRAGETGGEFAEIAQMGVECLGNVDAYTVCEVVCLALESLREVSGAYVLEVSHMGFAAGLLEAVGIAGEAKEKLFALIRQKNAHELRAALTAMGISPADIQRVEALTRLSGPIAEALGQAEALAVGQGMHQAIQELKALQSALGTLGLLEGVRLDVSILNDLDYYNGLVFQGYVQGAPRAVLSGGRYDLLLRKFGKEGDGIGFALYLDEVTRLLPQSVKQRPDIIALYEGGDDAGAVLAAVEALREEGWRVLAVKDAPGVPAGGKTMRFQEGRFKEVGSC